LFQPLAGDFDERRFRFVGPCCSFRPDTPAFPFERLDGRPLVLVSLGTVYSQVPKFLRRCMEELAGSPWQIVLATGGSSPMAPVPANFIVRPSVPQVEILRRASAFVTHGGMNSVQEALYYGVPLVLAPQAADQFWISARTAELGAGLVPVSYTHLDVYKRQIPESAPAAEIGIHGALLPPDPRRKPTNRAAA